MKTRITELLGIRHPVFQAADLPLAEALARGREANKRMRAFRRP